MQLLCLAEDIRTDQWDIGSLLRHNGCDLRQGLLQLQFWALSGGRHCTDRPVIGTGEKGEELLKLSSAKIKIEAEIFFFFLPQMKVIWLLVTVI